MAKEKVSLRVPSEVLAAVRAEVDAGRATDVTEYVTQAIADRVSRDRRAAAAWDTWGPFTEEEVDFAATLLDGGQRDARPPHLEHRAAS